jgi:hypothetical protein
VEKQLFEERDEGGEAFEREALGAEVARLDDLFEEIGAGEELEGPGWVEVLRLVAWIFHALLDPGTAGLVGDVHELDGQGAGIVAACFVGMFVVGEGLGDGSRVASR